MKTGITKFNNRVAVADADNPGKPKHSPTCEIPGCKTRYVVPMDTNEDPFHAVGLTAALVNDFRGDKRAICGEHYIRGLVKAGKHPNQSIMAPDGTVSITLLHEHWAQMEVDHAEIERNASEMRARMLERESDNAIR